MVQAGLLPRLASRSQIGHSDSMFSIEHEFDCTTVTLIDEGKSPLLEDVTLNSFAECVTVEQYDARTDQVHKITLSYNQIRDLAAALDLPEGVYRLAKENT